MWKELAGILRWTKTSYFLMSLFLSVVGLIIAVWWPLARDYLGQMDPRYPIWLQIDWLLIGIFLAMSILIMGGADLRSDAWIIFVGVFGGLTIESWGTQTSLWTYYTSERPPLWIIPAWPIASLAIDRISRLLTAALKRLPAEWDKWIYSPIFFAFYALMAWYAFPTIGKTLTIAALLLCAALIASPGNRRMATVAFLAGSGLGYFLELWGTTRECWTYYTRETPPVFAVFAHGMAAFAFWRAGEVLKGVLVPLMKKQPVSLVSRWRLVSLSKSTRENEPCE